MIYTVGYRRVQPSNGPHDPEDIAAARGGARGNAVAQLLEFFVKPTRRRSKRA